MSYYLLIASANKDVLSHANETICLNFPGKRQHRKLFFEYVDNKNNFLFSVATDGHPIDFFNLKKNIDLSVKGYNFLGILHKKIGDFFYCCLSLKNGESFDSALYKTINSFLNQNNVLQKTGKISLNSFYLFSG